MEAEQDHPELPADTQLFRGHTLAEAGQSWWAPKWLLVGFRMLSFVGLVSITVLSIMGGISTLGGNVWILFVSIEIWGPVLHFSGLLLLVICSFRGRSGSSSSRVGSKLANVAVPMYQIGSTLSVILGLTGIILLPLLSTGPTAWLLFVVAGFLILIHLFDSLVLGAMVRFRYMYVWIPTLLFAISTIISVVNAAALFSQNGTFPPTAVGILVGFVAAALVVGIVLTALTRVVPKCCCAGRKQPGAPNEQQSATGNA